MSSLINRDRPRRRTATAARLLIAGLAGSALALVAGMASGSTFTLKVRSGVHVTNNPTKALRVKPVDTHEAVAVGPAGFAVYTFQGESTHHIICKKTTSAKTNCWAFWPPVSPASAKGISKQSGISGKLGTFRNHGTLQLTLGGAPLYYFTPDLQSHNKGQATGDEIKTFGSIWHIVRAGGSSSGASQGPASTEPTMTTTTSTSTTTTTCAYPPYC